QPTDLLWLANSAMKSAIVGAANWLLPLGGDMARIVVGPSAISDGIRHVLSALFLFIALPCASLSAFWLNLFPNPHFENAPQLSAWSQFLSSAPDPVGAGAAPAWAQTPDFASSPVSGSALTDINTTTAATDAASGIAQCFNFPPATGVNF